jgi:hypothetical protein
MGYFKFFRKEDYLFSDDVIRKVTNLSQYTAIFSKIVDQSSYHTYYTTQRGERLDTISQKIYGDQKYYWTIPLLNERMINIWKDMNRDSINFIHLMEAKYPGLAFRVKKEDTTLISTNHLRNDDIVEYIDENGTSHTAKIYAIYPSLGYFHAEVTRGFNMQTLPNDIRVTNKRTKDALPIQSVLLAYNAPMFYVDENDNSVLWNSEKVVREVSIINYENNKNDVNSQIKVVRKDVINKVVSQFEHQMLRGRIS